MNSGVSDIRCPYSTLKWGLAVHSSLALEMCGATPTFSNRRIGVELLSEVDFLDNQLWRQVLL